MKFALATLLAAGFMASGALAAEHTVSQERKKFSERKMTIAVGDTVNFVNNDKITHNVYSSSSGHKFDMGAQAPGTAAKHTFSKPGKVKVRCAIHPKMKITLKVE